MKQVLTEDEYRQALSRVRQRLHRHDGSRGRQRAARKSILDLNALQAEELRADLKATKSEAKNQRPFEAFEESSSKFVAATTTPTWMVMDVVTPVIPPDLRPLVLARKSGNFATRRPQRPLPPASSTATTVSRS